MLVLNKSFLISKFSDYYTKIVLNQLNEDDLFELTEKYKPRILKLIYNLYPVLKYQQSGSQEHLGDIIFENIINPLIFDNDFIEF
jgi:hypothetical protein